MRIKRSSAIVILLENDRFVFHNFLVQQTFSANPTALEIIRRLHTWTDLERLVDLLPGYTRESIAGSVDQLTEIGAIIVEDSEAAEREDDFNSKWLWGPLAAAFHFSTRQGDFLTAEVTDELLMQQVKYLPSPALFATNSNPSSDIALPLRTDFPEPFLTMARRRTNRNFRDEPVTLEQLADCFQFSMAITGIIEDAEIVDLPLKMTPSGGGRNPFEAYVCARNVTGLAPGAYHYSAFDRTLGRVDAGPPPSFSAMLAGQKWAESAPAVIFLVANFDRVMWKYHDPSAYNVTVLEAGHIAQNIMLAATAHGLVANPTGAMALDLIETTLGVGGVTQSVVYGLVLGVAAEP